MNAKNLTKKLKDANMALTNCRTYSKNKFRES